jgi:4-alpha-glucanotransferase
LPTVTGWWRGADIVWRNQIGQTLPRADGRDPVEVALAERASDRAALWDAFQWAGVAPHGVPAPPPESAPVDEALAFVAATPSPLVTYPLEDLLALEDQPNLPGSIDEHPNWRRRLVLPIDELFDEPAFSDRLLAVDRARSAAAPASAASASDSANASSGPDTP